jgi:hypothetical protein
MSHQSPPSLRSERHRGAVRALGAIIPRKYFVARTGSQKLAVATVSYLYFLQDKGSARTSLAQLERTQEPSATGGPEISASARVEQETVAFEAARKTIVKLKQTRRRFKNMDKNERGERGISEREKSLNHTTDTYHSIVRDEVLNSQMGDKCTAHTETDDSEDEESVGLDNEPEENGGDGEDDEEESTADSNVTDQSSNKENRSQGSSDREAYPRLYQMGRRELLSGENAIAIGLGREKENRQVMLKTVCTELLDLQRRGMCTAVLLPDSFLAVKLDDSASKDRAMGNLRRCLSNLDFAETTDEHEASDAESSAGSVEAVHDGHRGRRADGHLNYGNLRVTKEESSSAGEIRQALTKLADIATALRRLENENVALRAMLSAHGMKSEEIAECLELISAGGDPKLAIFAVCRERHLPDCH